MYEWYQFCTIGALMSDYCIKISFAMSGGCVSILLLWSIILSKIAVSLL